MAKYHLKLNLEAPNRSRCRRVTAEVLRAHRKKFVGLGCLIDTRKVAGVSNIDAFEKCCRS
jgi:hypothetical protein